MDDTRLLAKCHHRTIPTLFLPLVFVVALLLTTVQVSGQENSLHKVRRGENLTAISKKFQVSISDIIRWNNLKNDRIYVGQLLRIELSDNITYTVKRGDALWEIARAYKMSVAEIKQINGLSSNRIYPGQKLKLHGSESDQSAVYTIKRGDNLTEIAALHQMSLPELRSLNGISGSRIYPGQKLRVKPILGPDSQDEGWSTGDGVDWSALQVSVDNVRKIAEENGPYYYNSPKADNQPSKNYFENLRLTPLQSYRQARKLWHSFESSVGGLKKLSNKLAGWHFVLDPGHGGVDPGAIVESKDSNGNTFFIVEDEYAYDMAIRVYVLLRLHGAEATLTVLSPDHLIRQNNPATRTFVHEKNEVFNSQVWNKKNRPSTWPKGGQKYLNVRQNVAKFFFRNTPANRRVFLSFHADNDPKAGDAVTLFYYQNRRQADNTSRLFANALLPALGAGARAKGRNLGVLRNNPASRSLLVETRNLAYADHVWAIRYAQLRQRDAEKVVKALLDGLSTN